MCNVSVVQQSIIVFPGQTFKVLAVGIGVGISPAVVRSRINSKYDISAEVQSLRNACEPLNYTILAPENISGIFCAADSGGILLSSWLYKVSEPYDPKLS